MSSLKTTQVEQSSMEAGGSVVFRRFHGSSIPVHVSGDRIYPFPPGTYTTVSKPTVGYDSRIPASNSWHFPAGSCRKRRLSWGFSPEIHGILLQESSSWAVSFFDFLLTLFVFIRLSCCSFSLTSHVIFLLIRWDFFG